MPLKSERLTEPQFKKGDRVRVIGHHTLPTGATGTVLGPGDFADTVKVEADNGAFMTGGWYRGAFELIEDGYTPQAGDRVRVTFEATIGDGNYGCICTSSVEGGAPIVRRSYIERLPGVTVEKLEPPVETFKPGDLVRSKGGRLLFYVAEDGYLDMTNHIWEPGTEPFTSKYYERVRLEEAPF